MDFTVGVIVCLIWLVPIFYWFMALVLYRWCPPYRRWRGAQIYKRFMKLWEQHRFWEASQFAERSCQVKQIARDKATAGFGLLWAQAAVLSHDPNSLSLIKAVIQSGHYGAAASEVAGTIFSNAGDSDRAEQCYKIARQLFQAEGDEKGIARVACRMAGTYVYEGRFEEALSLVRCVSATEASVLGTRQTIEAAICSLQGRHADALTILIEALPSSSGLSRPYVLLELANAHLYLGHIESAQKHLQEARVIAPEKQAMSLLVDIMTTRVLAQQNRTRASLAMLTQTEKQLMEYVAKRKGGMVLVATWPPRPQTQASAERDAEKDCAALAARIPMRFFYEAAGITTYDLEKYEQSLQYWNRLFSVKPGRVSRVTALYYIGECRRALGDNQAALQAYRAAVNVGIETQCATMARERLQEFDVVQALI